MPKALATLAGQALARIDDPVVMPKALRGADPREDTDPPAGKADPGASRFAAGKPVAATQL